MKNEDLHDDTIFDLLNYAEIDNNYDENFELDKVTSKRIRNKIKKNLNVRKRRFKYAASILIVISLGTFIIGNPALAANIKKAIFDSMMELYSGDYIDYDKYTQNIEASADDKGIRFIVNKVVADYNKIRVSYAVIGNKNRKDANGLVRASFEINGKQVFSTDISRSGDDEMLTEGIFILDTENEDIPEIFNLDIDVSSIGDLEGNWRLSLKMDKKKLMSDTKQYIINKEINLGEDKLNIKKITTSPLSTEIEVSGAATNKYKYFLFDDRGNKINSTSCHISGYGDEPDSNKGEFDYCSLINKDTKTLTFLPYEEDEKEMDEPVKYDMSNLPLEVAQGELGKVVVNKLEWDKDTLKIFCTTQGEEPLIQSKCIYLLDTNNKEIYGEYSSIDSSNRGDFILTFKGVDKSKKYKISTDRIWASYILREDHKFSIELK